MARHPLTGSEKAPLPGARSVGKADPAERLEVSVIVRRRAVEALKERVAKLETGDKSAGHIKREDFAKQFGANPGDMAAVKSFATSHGLAVVQEDAARRTVILSGTVAQFNAAFSVDLQQFEHDGGSYRGRTGPIQLPDELSGVVEAVLGLDNRSQAGPHFRGRPNPGNVHWRTASAASTSFTPTQLASLYNFPHGDGHGECIAIIELGGGYRTADLRTYFSRLNLKRPKVSAVSVDHGRNHATGDPNGPDGEVMLDIEIAGAIAPSAHIVVYFAPNTDAGFLDAITTAIHDTTNKPSVISISWGGPESSWTPQAMTAFDQAFQAAAAMGITVCAASGDSGSSDGVSDGADHVDFPASSPHVLACGGTSLQATNGKITRRGSLERRRQCWSGWRRCQHVLCGSSLAARTPDYEESECRGSAAEQRSSGCLWRRRPSNRIRHPCRWTGHGVRWDQRGRSAMGRFDRADKLHEGQLRRLYPSTAIQEFRGA